jgi:hypothetical protein
MRKTAQKQATLRDKHDTSRGYTRSPKSLFASPNSRCTCPLVRERVVSCANAAYACTAN